MNHKILTLTALSLLIAACGQKDERKTEKKTTIATQGCRHPDIPNHLRNELQQTINAEAKRLIGNDTHLIDAEKIATAAAQLKVTLNGIQDKNGQCRGKLSIVIPQNITMTAKDNAPLLNINSYDTIVEDSMGSINFQFNGSTLSLPLSYTVQAGDALNVNYEDDGFKTSASALTAALLPYGVNDPIIINGKPISREQALQIVQRGGSLSAPPPAPAPVTPPPTTAVTTPTPAPAPRPSTPQPTPAVTTPPTAVNVETPEQKALREAKAAELLAQKAAQKAAERAAKAKALREAKEAKALTNNKTTDTANPTNHTTTSDSGSSKTAKADTTKLDTSKSNNKMIDFTEKTKTETKTEEVKNDTPETPKPKARVNDDELDKIRKAHNQADQEIKSSWKKISPEIRKDLVEEQKTWEKQRNQRCRQVAAAGGDESESSKLYMQCDTRMTKERVKNLEGYSIQ